ncbi:hypothetical protein HNY73_001341 [Argiope bruennichi]|uniref:Gustatory receptor n=1 Tax=Argiope bruennichi TaxID=94029 RepID=A0A8T0G292_ARGBR|nr:hypothetical protein HNY73_001341 [Argiope bruennichi]
MAKLWEIKSTSHQNVAVACSGDDNVVVKLQEQISELSLQVNELNKRHYSLCQQFRSRSRKFIAKSQMLIARQNYKRILRNYQELSITLTFADGYLSYPAFAAVLECMVGLFWCVYSILSSYDADYLNVKIIYMVIAIYSILLLILMVPAALTNEAAKESRRLIESLPGWFPQRHKEINLRILRLFKSEPALTLWEIYRIEKSLVINVIGTLLTYGLLVGTFGSGV